MHLETQPGVAGARSSTLSLAPAPTAGDTGLGVRDERDGPPPERKPDVFQRFTTEPRAHLMLPQGETQNYSILKEPGEYDLCSRKGNKNISAASYFRH